MLGVSASGLRICSSEGGISFAPQEGSVSEVPGQESSRDSEYILDRLPTMLSFLCSVAKISNYKGRSFARIDLAASNQSVGKEFIADKTAADLCSSQVLEARELLGLHSSRAGFSVDFYESQGFYYDELDFDGSPILVEAEKSYGIQISWVDAESS